MASKEYVIRRVKQVIGRRLRWRVVQRAVVDDSDQVALVSAVSIDWDCNVPKPRVGLVADHDTMPYWTKYRRFLEHNSIPYRLFDIHASTWIDNAKKLDVVVVRPTSSPSRLAELRNKIYVLEHEMGLTCYPSFRAISLYEDKVMQYYWLKLQGLPVIETFVSHDYEEASRFVQHADMPLVAKIETGSASHGVELLKNKSEARRYVRRVFSYGGRKTYWPYLNQKDYVYLQPLVANEGYDLRVIVIGSFIFGYFRHSPQSDFRASGMGLVEKEALPEEAIAIAERVAQAMEVPMLAVDMLRESETGAFKIIEVSPFFRIETPEQLHVAGRPGAYVRHRDGTLSFREGQYWPQELALLELFSKWVAARSGSLSPEKPG